MTCPGCQAALPDDAAFCGHCGRALQSERTCPRCGRPNAAEMHFCLGCGSPLAASGATRQPDPRTYTPKHLAERILTSRAALEGERKQVTVLFADVKGSMDLAEQLDPEAWHGIMDEEGRERALREAHRLFTEIGATGHAERLAREISA